MTKIIKPNNSTIISRLEEELGFKLKAFKTKGYLNRENTYYIKDKRVLGLKLSNLNGLPKTLSLFTSIEEIYLNRCFLTEILSLSKLSNLQVLHLANNRIKDISPLKLLRNLKQLRLENNQIEDISSLVKLTNLEELDLDHNKIRNISPLANLRKLQSLTLDNNQIEDIADLKNLKELQELKLWANPITNITALSGLTNLRRLDLFNISTNDFSALKDLRNINYLDAGKNELEDISFLSNLTNLVQLDLWNNPLTDISPLEKLISLQELRLNNCRVSDIGALEKLNKLSLLDVTNNKLTSFPKWLLNSKLENTGGRDHLIPYGFSVHNNPIENVPIELLNENLGVITDYFKSLENGSQPINEIKVILLGEGSAGKTSILNYLNGKPFNKQEPQTHGINLEDCVNENGVSMKVWDFGGQDIMHHTHQLFLTQKSIYVLVLNARENTDTEKWLKLIQVFGGDSPIIIVTNKIDENPSAHENIKYLNTKYPNLKSRYVKTSLATEIGLNDLKNILTETIKELLHVRTIWGNNWLAVKKELEEMRNEEILKDYIHFEKYEEICDKNGVVKSHRDTLINWLNRLGVITYFSDPNLSETNVINPSWLTEAFYAIINSQKIADNFGRFSLNQLTLILDKQKYPKQKHGYLIGLMTKFELCYKIDELNFLIPDLLNKEEPEFGFDIPNSLKFKFKYKNLLPKAILPKFMVRRNREISNDKKWRTGLLINDPYFESQALIRIDDADKEIFVYVNGNQIRGYLASIISDFEEINNLYEGLEYSKEVPCICHSCKKEDKPYYYEYDVLVNSKRKGRETYICKFSDEDVAINDLLGILITREQLESEIQEIVGRGVYKTKKHIEDGNVPSFINTVKSLFSSVSYLLFEKNEKAYHTPLFILLRSIFSINARADEIQAKGRTDIVINSKKYIYILELKLDDTAENAIKQIHTNKYYEPYQIEDKQIILVGINFNSETRNIENYLVEFLVRNSI
jgi:small GTP-binding protein